jgi:polyisoprenoid-binding protein YceI
MKSLGSRIIVGILSTLILHWASDLSAQQEAVYSIAPAKSKMEVHVYKDGFFKALGHDHLIAARAMSGQVQFDAQNIENSKVSLKVEAKSLTVIDPGESQKDRQDVQATMLSERVLDVAQFPEIVFSSAGVSSVKKTATAWELTLSGSLKLHGVEKKVSIPLRLHAEIHQLEAQGEVSLRQTEYGITPVKVAGGAVKVKDKLTVSFTIVAATTNP